MSRITKRKATRAKAKQKAARKRNKASPEIEEMAMLAADVSEAVWHILPPYKRQLYRLQAIEAMKVFEN